MPIIPSNNPILSREHYYNLLNDCGNYNYCEELDLEITEEDNCSENIDEEKNSFYYDCSYLFEGTIKEKGEVFRNLILEIDGLSWELFEQNMIGGADCIDIFSPQTAKIFDMGNILTDNIKFNTNKQYTDKNSFLIGNLNDKYKIFMPKIITRTVLSEKTSNKNNHIEQFIEEKFNKIEIYNSNIPDKRFTITLENAYHD